MNSKKAIRQIKVLTEYLRGITKHADSMVVGINKLTDACERDVKIDENSAETVSSCLNLLPNQIRTINEIFSSHVKIAQQSAAEGLEVFGKLYASKTVFYIQEATRYRNDLRTAEK